MAGGGEAAAETRRLHPRWWPVGWEGKITQAPPALPALDATLHYHGDAQVVVEEAAFARRQPVPIPMDWQRPGLVVLGGPRLVPGGRNYTSSVRLERRWSAASTANGWELCE